jgi:transketolase C-terminal domain/subunit
LQVLRYGNFRKIKGDYIMTSREKVWEVYPLAECRYKHGKFKIVKDGYGSWENSIVIGVGFSANGAWKNAWLKVEEELTDRTE